MTHSHLVQANLSWTCFCSVERDCPAEPWWKTACPHPVPQQIKARFMDQSLHSVTLHDSACLCGASALFWEAKIISSARRARWHVSYPSIRQSAEEWRRFHHLLSRTDHEVMRLQLTGSTVLKLWGNRLEVNRSHTLSVSDHTGIMWLFVNHLPDKVSMRALVLCS